MGIDELVHQGQDGIAHDVAEPRARGVHLLGRAPLAGQEELAEAPRRPEVGVLVPATPHHDVDALLLKTNVSPTAATL